MLKIAFVGMGSIGKRHLINVCAFLEQERRAYVVDLYRSGYGRPLEAGIASKIHREFSLTMDSIVSERYDAVFITNPTVLHYETIRRFAGAANAMFIEKPVFDGPDLDVDALGLLPDGIYYVACPLRYHPVIVYVREHVPCETVYAARAISSSYLPDWRQGVDYRACYSAHRDMGGGVDIDLIHEWDYLTGLFGPVRTGFAIRGQVSHLEIDSNDIAIYIARTEHTAISLHLDYFGRKSIRQLQLFLPEETIDCDILSGTIHYQVSGREISFERERNNYQMAEVRHFFEILDGKYPNDSDIPGALRVLKYAKGMF